MTDNPRPERCILINSQTGERMTCQFNPSQLRESYRVKYAHHAPNGAGSEILHYTGTENGRWPMEFYLETESDNFDTARFSEFLRAFKRPSPSAPPALMLVWPNFVTLSARVTELSFTFDTFAPNGTPRTFTARVELEATEVQHA